MCPLIATKVRWTLILLVITSAYAASSASCAHRSATGEDGDVGSGGDACACRQPSGDEDGDKIPDGVEGCCTDTDGDKISNYQDLDSDDDGVSDDIEAGPGAVKAGCGLAGAKGKGWPCDTDGDGVPDYLDKDSDGDGLLDICEDGNGDGELGCCLGTCGKLVGNQVMVCSLGADGCGPDQGCKAGSCSPPRAFGCLAGETDRLKPDTFGDGVLDTQRGMAVCRNPGQCGGTRKVLKSRALGDWQVAMPKGATFTPLTIPDAASQETAAAIDARSSPLEVAGFVLSRTPKAAGINDEAQAVLDKLATLGGLGSSLVVRGSGTAGKSHDCYDQIQGLTLELGLSAPGDLGDLRNAVVALLLGKQQPVTGSSPFGVKASEVVLRLALTRRFEPKRDAQGNTIDEDGKVTTKSGKCPADSGAAAKRRLLIAGALVRRTVYVDPKQPSRILADDLTNGTSLADGSRCVTFRGCATQTITTLPTAEILWVVDEGLVQGAGSGPWAALGSSFFARALTVGLNVRVGVTGMPSPTGVDKALVGKLCSQISTDPGDDGGTDRFLLPTEQSIFASCFANPPGSAAADSHHGLTGALQAVQRHLPRTDGKPDRIRPDAALAVIAVTDHAPACLAGALDATDLASCTVADSAKQAAIATAIKPALTLLSGTGDPEARAVLHLIGGGCGGGCKAEVAHGYRELARKLGGLTTDVCGLDTSATAQQLVDAVAGQASPLKLPRIPISASLAVALDGVELPRSLVKGFDYRPASNSIVLVDTKHAKGSEVVISYGYWELTLSP